MSRTLLLALAVLLGLAGIAISVRDMLVEPPAPPPRTIAVAKAEIPTYTRIDASMLEEQTVPAGQARFAYDFSEAVGKMTTERISPGQTIGPGEAKRAEEVRFVDDPNLEITSFSGRFDEMVGGQLKRGAKINIYGYHQAKDEDEPGDVTLVARDVWVVDVRASSGEATSQPTPTPGGSSSGSSGGLLGGSPFVGRGDVPASVVTVAAEPEVVWKIIQALGAGGYEAWVTLAGRQTYEPTPTASPTAQATYTPYPTYTPIPSPTPAQEARAEPEISNTPTPGSLPTTGGPRVGGVPAGN